MGLGKHMYIQIKNILNVSTNKFTAYNKLFITAAIAFMMEDIRLKIMNKYNSILIFKIKE